jgi:soluble lytic murein transglycosylase
MKKSAKLNIFLLITVFLFMIVAGYFYLPQILGDTVYPLKYEDLIVKYSNERGLDPSLVAAVIMQESRFNPTAVSYAGAQGLMQIMPGTQKGIASKLGYSSWDIYDPETAINFGTYHLQGLMGRYNSNIKAVLAGYNAGGGNADLWLRLGMLDSIPSSEPRNYVKNVINYQQIYASLYPDELALTGTEYSVKVETKTEPVYSPFWKMIFQRFALPNSSGAKE